MPALSRHRCPHTVGYRGSLTAWAAAVVAAVVIVKGTRVGPVVLVVSDRRGWGVHAGDMLAVLPMLAAASVSRRRH